MIKCPMCQAHLKDLEAEIQQQKDKIGELENAINEAKKVETKEEADNIFDALG